MLFFLKNSLGFFAVRRFMFAVSHARSPGYFVIFLVFVPIEPSIPDIADMFMSWAWIMSIFSFLMIALVSLESR